MRLWHYNMLDVLPKKQLIAQLRECVAIAKDIYEKGKTNHILINRIMDYDLQEFRDYCNILIYEMIVNRKYSVKTKTIEKLQKYIDLQIDSNPYNKHCVYEVPLFEFWHDKSYLKICYYNLYEKFLCGGIEDYEWFNVSNKYYTLMNKGMCYE